MMKADPSAATFFDVLDEGGLRSRRPVVGRVVELDEELVVREELVVDLVRVLDVIDGEVILRGLLIEPDLGGFNEGQMNSAGLGDGDDAEPGLGIQVSDSALRR